MTKGSLALFTMPRYPTQSHYPDTELTSRCPILIMVSAWLGSGKYQFFLIHWCDSTRVLRHTQLIQPSRLENRVGHGCI